MKESSSMVKICDWITKYSAYALLFLLPIFYLPWASEVLDFNKQALIIFLSFISIFAWMLKVLVSGKLEFNKNKVHIFIGIFFLIFLLATTFSVDKYGSFWGWPRVTADSLLTIIGLIVIYFAYSSVFSKKEVVTSIYVFSASALLAEIYGIFQLFGLYVIPFSFAKNVSFNTIGNISALGIFAAAILPLMIAMIILAKKWHKVLFGAVLFFSAVILFLINFPFIWWVTAFGCALMMITAVFKRNLFDGRWMALPMFFLAVSLFFIVLNMQINILPQKTSEIFLSAQSSFEMGVGAIKERPIFGSGPGTFSYDFSKFKNADFNKTILWSVAFNGGYSKIFTLLPTIGIAGILAFLALVGVVIFYTGKSIIFDKWQSDSEGSYSVVKLGVFGLFASLLLSYFLTNSNIVLDFLFFWALAVLVVLIFEKKKEYELKPSSLLTLGVTFVFTLVFIFGLGLMILTAQRYIAEVNYYGGLANIQSDDLDKGIQKIETAVSMNSGSDLYYRQLSQIYLVKLQVILSDKDMSQDDKKKNAEIYVSAALNASSAAASINPYNSMNWLVRGYVCQNLAGFVSDSAVCAEDSYAEAMKLDPVNPYPLVQRGSVYYQNKDYESAKNDFEQALALKSDYSNALYFYGLSLDKLGQKSKAIEQFSQLLSLNPDSSSDIQKIIDNLKNGNSALYGLAQEAPETQAPEEIPTDQINNSEESESK